jgi:hypothetical protein
VFNILFDRIGLDWNGLDWIGLDWIGLDWIGMDWTGLDWIGAHSWQYPAFNLCELFGGNFVLISLFFFRIPASNRFFVDGNEFVGFWGWRRMLWGVEGIVYM